MKDNKGIIAFIVDDNPTALETLATDLKRLPEVDAVYTFSSYNEATLPLLELQPDVLFLDVEVPGKSGIDFLESIQPKISFTFKVVFYTGFANYMIDAIRQSAFDFLLKPYKQSELRTVMDRVIKERRDEIKPSNVLYTPNKIAMQTICELLLVTMEEVLLFNYQNEQRTWRLTLTDGSQRMLRKGVTADDIVLLHSTFVRISNTCIINLTYLAGIENKTQRCRFGAPFDQFEPVISRRYFSKLKERLELL